MTLAGTVQAAPAKAPTTEAERKAWYDTVADDESSMVIAFVFDGGKREKGFPYIRFQSWERNGSEVEFAFGEYKVYAKFSEKFPLRQLLIHFRFQRIASIYEIPGEVTLTVVKIDFETGAEEPI
jgi:hypothetical protein